MALYGGSKPKGDTFQIMGMDIMIDTKLNAWLIEINESPSMNINQCIEGQTLQEGLIKSISEVDKHIKTTCVGDAMKLMLSTKGKKKTRSTIEQYGTWKKLDVGGFMDDHLCYMQAVKVF